MNLILGWKEKEKWKITNTRNGESEMYKEAFYTKFDGIYGFICVDGCDVKFFYVSNGEICMDILFYFKIEYMEGKI